MKKLALALCILICSYNITYATPKTDFETMINKIDFLISHYTVDKSYTKWEFIGKKTNNTKKFSDFTEMERKIFFFMRGQKLDNDFAVLHAAWLAELEKAEEKPADVNQANKNDIKSYLNKLEELQTKNAIQLENLLELIFKKWENKFTKEEKEYLINTTKEFHDKHKLIDRTKILKK